VLEQVVRQLAPKGVLRAGLNTANVLLVSGSDPAGEPTGVAPDLARAIAARLGVPVSFSRFAKASDVGDAVEADAWDIAFIGAEPARAQTIAFTAAYAEIEATYMVPPGSMITSVAEVDRPGVRVAVGKGSAYDLWLTRHVTHAELVRAPSVAASYIQFVTDRLDALAGLRPGLLDQSATMPGAKVLDGRFTAVQQAVGTARAKEAGAAYLSAFVEDAKRSGLVARLIERHGARGLSVGPIIE